MYGSIQLPQLAIRPLAFFLLAIAVWLPAQLCRNFAEYSEPWRTVGLTIRHGLGWFAPFYEHIASGAGLSFWFGAIVWLLLCLAPKLRRCLVTAKHPLLAKVQAWLLAPPYEDQEIVVLFVAPLPAVLWSFAWEIGQASGRFKGGNLDGSVQLDHIGADLTGVVIFVLSCKLLIFPLFRRAISQPG